ncbi:MULTISPECIES: hypothetical protein [unclassified Bradyrhizobium]|uniref:hypothetical protein n=1 Tax=unclassified Bradyrhizobium TaxID=2631580 RepID=UPI000412F556|nr:MULTISPECIES: hypothetical protein [unclassified Bradyrhizobium]MCP3464128.1 hypothetical protein [Bradyrhizobium sp. CCGUVB23]
MIRLLLTGLWVCVLTAGGSYAVAYWKENGGLIHKDEYLDGLQYQKTRALSVPMVENGSVQGYIVARFVYTVEARTMHQLTVPPDPFVIDEAFRKIYADDRLDFRKLARYDLSILTAAIKQRVNERMQADVIQDVLVEDFNYVSREEFQPKP